MKKPMFKLFYFLAAVNRFILAESEIDNCGDKSLHKSDRLTVELISKSLSRSQGVISYY